MKAMKQITRILSFLAVVGAAAVGCTGLDVVPIDRHSGLDPESPGIVTLTTTVGIGTSPATKALDADGKKTFAADEKVALIYTKSDGTTKAISEYTIQSEDISNGGKNAKLSFTLDDPKAGDVTLVYPASLASTAADDGIDLAQLQSNQDGTLATLSASFDAATATVNMTISGETASMPASIALTNPLTIGEFTITDKDESSADVTSAITQLTVNDGTNTFTVNRAAADGPIYVAMLPVTSDKTITLTAASSAHHYLKAVTGKALAANNLYPISVDMPQDMLYEPLTIVTTNDYTMIYVFNAAKTSNGEDGEIKYTINGGEEQTIYYEETIIYIPKANSIVRFYGDNATYSDQDQNSNIYVDDNCYIYGNIMSLISSTDYATATALTKDNTFNGLFKRDYPSDELKNHPSKPLLLPATTLTERCYREMFSGRTGLTSAPALPATTLTAFCYSNMFSGCTGLTTAPALSAPTLAEGCYYGMFSGCTSLATAPALPAETLAEKCYMYMFDRCTELTTAPALPAGTMKKKCYYQMFYGCTKLTTAPALPATTLAEECYSGMFAECTKLTTAPDLPATILADWCYNYMFNGCTSLTTAPALSATTLAPRCYMEMFNGCTSLTTAPVLPAPTLAISCYRQMFQGCTKLNSVTCLATDIKAETCTSNWLDNAGTDESVTSRQFFTPSATAWARPSVSGIPDGWTRVNTTPVSLSSLSNNYEAKNGDILTGTLANNVKISIAAGATVILDSVSINADGTWTTGDHAGITCLGDATINLVGTNTVTGFEWEYPGIQAGPKGNPPAENTTLTIQGTGSLTASCNSINAGGAAAGIGGGFGIACGNIVIAGGRITANGGGSSAGIGGGAMNGDCGTITISGGTVVATGYDSGPGIGAGVHATCGVITISGGNVTATASYIEAAGIGTAGMASSCGDILISGGTVVATGSNSSLGIGAGYHDCQCRSITIGAGITSVTAIRGVNTSDTDPCIGKVNNGYCSSVTFGTQEMFFGGVWGSWPQSGSDYGGLHIVISETNKSNDTWTLTQVTSATQ